MKNKNLFRIFSFILIVVISDQLGGIVLCNLYFNQKQGPNKSLNYVFSDCTSDILIFGNSRAQHHYDSRLISDSLKMSCYNAGQDGGHSILLSYAQIKVLTKRYSPKIVILEFSPDNVKYLIDAYDKLSILLPYYSIYPELRPVVRLRGSFENVKLLSAIYPFNSNIINILRFNTSTNSSRKKDFEGYIPIKDKEMNLGMIKNEPELIPNAVIDTNMTNALKNIISICVEKKIKLIVVSSPIFHTTKEKRNLVNPLADVALNIMHKKNVTHFDYSYDSLFIGRLDLFADKKHLNEKGATVFSRSLVKRIKQLQNMN